MVRGVLACASAPFFMDACVLASTGAALFQNPSLLVVMTTASIALIACPALLPKHPDEVEVDIVESTG